MLALWFILAKSMAKNECKTHWWWSGSWVLGIQSAIVCPKKLWICVCRFMDLHWIVLWGTFTFKQMHLLPGIQDTGILWIDLFWLEPNLRMGWTPGIQLLRRQIQMLCPPLNAPHKVNVHPPCIANGSILDESSGCMEVHSSETRRTLSMRYTGISFCMCRHPRGELIGCRTYLESKWGLPDSIHASWCAKCLHSPRDGSGPQWDCH
jgi:hypothetical protein